MKLVKAASAELAAAIPGRDGVGLAVEVDVRHGSGRIAVRFGPRELTGHRRDRLRPRPWSGAATGLGGARLVRGRAREEAPQHGGERSRIATGMAEAKRRTPSASSRVIIKVVLVI